MRRIYTCFPEGRFKALTLSYDDGKITDRRLIDILNQNGLKGTFHLNSGYFGETKGHRVPYITREEAADLYRGHEIASHTSTHPTMARMPMEGNLQEILEDRKTLEEISGYPVRGFSYPNGVHGERLYQLLRSCGIAYGRITKSSKRFDLPDCFYAWKPTCHHKEQLMEHLDRFLDTEYDQRLMLFYVWGHSYEFELDHNWKLMEEFAKKAGNWDSIWYATNIEIYDYLKCAENLVYFADLHGVHNPGAEDVWIQADGEIHRIPGGQTYLF